MKGRAGKPRHREERTMKKTHAIFDSLWFNVGASIVSVVVFAEQIWELITEGYSVKPIVMLIIWIVIGFHFIQKTYFCLRDRRTDPGSSDV